MYIYIVCVGHDRVLFSFLNILIILLFQFVVRSSIISHFNANLFLETTIIWFIYCFCLELSILDIPIAKLIKYKRLRAMVSIRMILLH